MKVSWPISILHGVSGRAFDGIWDVLTTSSTLRFLTADRGARHSQAQTLPLVGCPTTDDCREFSCAGYCSEADEPQSSADFQRGQRIGSAEPPAGVEEHPPVSPPAGPTFADWAEPAIWTALEPHKPHWNRTDTIVCCGTLFWDWQGWREHVGKLIAAHLENAHKLNVRDGLGPEWGSSFAAQMFPQFRKK